MNYTQIDYTLAATDRKSIRKAIVALFLEEESGTGKNENATRYKYVVETYCNYHIILKRPARYNNGFDFIITTDGLEFKRTRRYSNPKHDDIIDILKQFQNANSQVYKQKVIPTINKIFNCKNIKFSNKSFGAFFDYKAKRHPIEVVLLALKWLFIEQDITYWNYSGRQRLYDELKKQKLV